jgi:hypothetical protein
MPVNHEANGEIVHDGWITASYNALNQPISMTESGERRDDVVRLRSGGPLRKAMAGTLRRGDEQSGDLFVLRRVEPDRGRLERDQP